MKITKTVAASPRGEIAIYTLTNASGAWVELSALGAGINAIVVPDSAGNLENVALGYANAAHYISDGPCMGKIPGRYANRIAGGKFTIVGWTINSKSTMDPMRCMAVARDFTIRFGTVSPPKVG